MPEMEHRWGERIGVMFPVHLRCLPAAIGAGRLRDLSLSGAFIETTLALAPCARVDVSFDWIRLDGTLGIEQIEAHVVRTGPDGIGVEWSELAPAGVRAVLSEAASSGPWAGLTHAIRPLGMTRAR